MVEMIRRRSEGRAAFPANLFDKRRSHNFYCATCCCCYNCSLRWHVPRPHPRPCPCRRPRLKSQPLPFLHILQLYSSPQWNFLVDFIIFSPLPFNFCFLLCLFDAFQWQISQKPKLFSRPKLKQYKHGQTPKTLRWFKHILLDFISVGLASNKERWAN